MKKIKSKKLLIIILLIFFTILLVIINIKWKNVSISTKEIKNNEYLSFPEVNTVKTGIKHIVYLGEQTSRTFKVTSYSGYENFTVDNFIVGIKSISKTSCSGTGPGIIHWGVYLKESYKNGTLTISPYGEQGNEWGLMVSSESSKKSTVKFFAYLLY